MSLTAPNSLASCLLVIVPTGAAVAPRLLARAVAAASERGFRARVVLPVVIPPQLPAEAAAGETPNEVLAQDDAVRRAFDAAGGESVEQVVCRSVTELAPLLGRSAAPVLVIGRHGRPLCHALGGRVCVAVAAPRRWQDPSAVLGRALDQLAAG